MKTLKTVLLFVVFSLSAKCANAQQCGTPSASLAVSEDDTLVCPASSSYPYLVEAISKYRSYNFSCTADSNVSPPPNPGTVYWSYNEPTLEAGGMGQRTVITPLPIQRMPARHLCTSMLPEQRVPQITTVFIIRLTATRQLMEAVRRQISSRIFSSVMVWRARAPLAAAAVLAHHRTRPAITHRTRLAAVRQSFWT